MARKNTKGGVHYFLHRKHHVRPIAYSTKATSDLLALLAESGVTIAEIRQMINFDDDAIAVCDAYIAKGEGDVVPSWR